VQTSSPSKDEEWWRAPKRTEASMRVLRGAFGRVEGGTVGVVVVVGRGSVNEIWA
jgi:hypothetical protein